jgi:hypothetical protein
MSVYPPQELRSFLVNDLGIARMPSDNPLQEGDAIAYVDPLGGTPYGPDAPADTPASTETTIGLTEAGGLASIAGVGKYMENLFVRVDVRSSSPVAAANICREITNALEDQQAIQIGELRCEYVGIYARAQSIPVDQETSAGFFKTLTLAMVIHREELQ